MMRLSRYFLPVAKETPSEAQIVSHQLMLRAGLIKQQQAGVYVWLPFGLKVLRNIEKIVREEQDRSGALELLMPTMQSADLWRESGRYDDYGAEMLRIKDRHDRDMLFGPTAEEVVTDVVRTYIRSYKDLPLNLYNIQWKFRDEVRPRFGVMRGREFLMKDAYSFDIDADAAVDAYRKMFLAYLRTFQRLGLRGVPMRAATGPIGGDLSHEFIILAKNGESAVFYDSVYEDKDWTTTDISFENDDASKTARKAMVDEVLAAYAATDEMHEEEQFLAKVPEERRREGRGIEVGHIFFFGDKYSKPMNAKVMGKDGKEHILQMGSYGIGVSRLVGAVIEASHDEHGIIWPTEIAPFNLGIVNLKSGDAACDELCKKIYDLATAKGLDPLYDDRDERAGAKFATMDVIGVPKQVVIGPRGVANGIVEVKNRKTQEKTEMKIEDFIASLS